MNADMITNGTASPSASTPAELLDLFDRLTECVRDGDTGRVEALLRAHPEHETRLRSVLPALGVMNCLKDASEQGDASANPIWPEPITPSGQQPRANSQQPDSTLGDFRLIREIGRGGMGVVYEAEQVSLGRRVAVKVLPLAGVLDKRALARFQNEARAAATLFHPHIVPVFFVGVERGVNFYAMQLIEGHSLADVIATLRGSVVSSQLSVGKSPPPTDHGQRTTDQPATDHGQRTTDKSQIDTQALAALTTERTNNPKRYFHRMAEIGIQAAQALHHAHDHGILHRDVKPANILLDDEGQTWITDFGLARLEADASMTATGDIVGTLRYMSPEQVSGARAGIDHRTDVYSLGITLYELATGTPAFPGTDRRDLLRRITEQDPPPPRQLRPEIPADLETILLKAIEKDPADRYASAQFMADDLRRFANHESIHARRPSLAARGIRWTRRHPSQLLAATLALAVCFVAALAAFGVASIERERTAGALAEKTEAVDDAQEQRDRANEERRRAEDERERAVQSLKLARGIVDSLYLKLGTQWIADETAPSNFQREILADAAKFYEQLIEAPVEGSTDLGELSLASSGYSRIAIIEHYLQNYDEAVDARQKTIAVVRQALASAPRNPAIRSTMSEIHYELGQSLLELSRFEDAKHAFTEASTFASELVADEVDPVKHRYWLARADLARAGVLAQSGSLAEATRLARTARDNLMGVSREGHKDQPFGGELQTEIRRADYWLAKSLAYAGDLAEAAEICKQALESCRRQRTIQQDDARLRTLEIDLQELSAEIAGLQGDLATAAEEYRRVLDMRRDGLRSGLPPEQLFTQWFAKQNVNMDGLTEPGPFCAYVETQLRLAHVLRRAGRPYEAEAVLGECTLVTAALVAERPNALRYRIVDANVFAMASEVLAEHRPADAEILYRRAVEVWIEAVQQYPHSLEFVSGVHGVGPDWDYFQEVGRQIARLPSVEHADEKVNTHKTVWHFHSNGRSFARIGEWEWAIAEFEKSAALRMTDHAYDWLQLSIAHAQFGQQEEAQEWLQKAEDSISQMTEPHVELIELRDEARMLVLPNQPDM